MAEPGTSVEKLTTDEVLTFWQKYKDKIWAIILLVFGAAGGNVDRLYSNLPDVYGTVAMKADIVAIKTKLDNCCGVATPVVPTPAVTPTDGGVKVERPSK